MEVSGQLLSPALRGERTPRTNWIVDWMGPRAGLDVVVKRTIVSFCQEHSTGRNEARGIMTVNFRIL
jgi:hypothetical protein